MAATSSAVFVPGRQFHVLFKAKKSQGQDVRRVSASGWIERTDGDRTVSVMGRHS